jgi:hypothetical protein
MVIQNDTEDINICSLERKINHIIGYTPQIIDSSTRTVGNRHQYCCTCLFPIEKLAAIFGTLEELLKTLHLDSFYIGETNMDDIFRSIVRE